MKLKQVLAGFLTGVMVVANLPSFGIDGIGLQKVQAEERSSVDDALVYRYQSIQGMKAYAGWATRYDAPIENLLKDDTSITYSRYNTGYIPRSTYISDRNNIFIKLNTTSTIKKLSYYPNETERSGGNGSNVGNGTFTRVNVYVSTEEIGDNPTKDDANWELALENIRLDSDTDLTADNSTIPRHNFEFKEAIANVKGLRIQVLNTAGQYQGDADVADKDKRDTFISGRELEVYGESDKIAASDMTFTADFGCHTDQDVLKLNDGNLETTMHSTYENDEGFGTDSPVKTNEGHYFANNNMYFTLPESTRVGKLTYVAGALNGSIKRARIYVSNVELGEGEEPKDIHESAWLKVYDNTDESAEAWQPYLYHGTIANNSTEVVFDSAHMARHVRVEVLETQYSEDTAPQNRVTNKWISGRRVYIYAAEPLNQVEAQVNTALSEAAGGQAKVVAYTGEAQGKSYTNFNDNVGDNKENDNYYWLPKYDIRPTGADAGKTNYIVLDLGTTETDISEISIRWHNMAFATKYKIETSETCRVSGDVTDAANKAVNGEGDEWATVVDYTGREDMNSAFPKDVFSGDSLRQNKLKRYVRLSMTETNGTAGLWTVVREFQIKGSRFQVETVKNVALGSAIDGFTTVIKAYTGAGADKDPSYVIDGRGINNEAGEENNTRWEAGRPMKEGGSVDTPGAAIDGAVSYIILDLGEHASTQVESIRIRWADMMFGKEYEIQTSDTCDVNGDVGNEVTEDTIAGEANAAKWETVASVTKDITGRPNPAPLDEFGDGKAYPLHKTYLKRYVRLLVTKMNLYAGAHVIGVKEIEINGIRRKAEISDVVLDWTFENALHEEGETAPTLEATPRYGSVFRSPSTKQGASYHVTPDTIKWEQSNNGTDGWVTAERDYFDFGKYYRGSVEISSLGAPFSELVDVKVNNSTEGVSVAIKDGRLAVSKVYAPLTDYTEQYTALKTWFAGDDSKAIRERYGQAQGDVTNNAWKRFTQAYEHVRDHLARELTDEDMERTAPGGFRPNDFADGKEALLNAYRRLTTSAEELTLDHPVMITVDAPADGKGPADAKLTRGGKVVTSPDDLAPEKGDLEYSIGPDNELIGNIKFENAKGGNSVFNVTGTNQFLMNFELFVPKKLDHKESIIGKFDKQYALQIDQTKLYLFGELGRAEGVGSGGWHQTNCNIPNDDWYGVWHNVVAIYNGSKFKMYVDGVASTDPASHASRAGALKEDAQSIFAIGYNPDRRVNDSGSNHADEGFSGGIRNIRMFVQNGEEGDDFPDWQTAIEGKTTPEEIETAFSEVLEGKTAELEIGGEPALYEVASTKWTPADTEFDIYKEYKVDVEVKTLPGITTDYMFPENAEVEVTGLPEAEQSKVTHTLNEDKDTLTISYTFPRAEHPRDVLNEYLDNLAETIEVVDPAQNKDANNARVYTRVSWDLYIAKYQAALARKDDAISKDTEEACQNAYDELTAAVGRLAKAAETCECGNPVITTPEDGTETEIDMGTETTKTVTLPTPVATAEKDCMVAGHANKAVEFEYAIDEEHNDAGAVLNDAKTELTVTKTGDVNIVLTATIGDGKSSTATIIYKAIGTALDMDAQERTDLANKAADAKNKYPSNLYTAESWQILKDAIDKAEEEAARPTATAADLDAASKAIDAAISGLVKADDPGVDPGEDSISALRELVTSLAESIKKEDYTAESYNAFVAIFNQAVEELNKENPDAARCAALLEQLKKAKENLLTNAQDIANAKTEVSGAIAAADAVYNAGQKDYDAALWKAFTDAYNAAKNAPANADAATLRKLAAALKAAQAALKPAAAAGLTNGYVEKVGTIQYKVLSADKKTVMAYRGTSKKAKNITIPATVKIKGITCKVTQIGAKAFSGYNRATKITIGKNVTTIGKQAFLNCKKINQIILKGKALKNEKSIKANAFKGTSKKKVKIKWPKGIKKSQKNKLIKGFKKRGLKV